MFKKLFVKRCGFLTTIFETSMAHAVENNNDLFDWKEIAVLWSIKGYHSSRIRPCEDIPMLVLPEDGNAYDENAMMVKMPDIIPEEYHDRTTREGDARQRTQKVADIVGKQVGRVPANLCRAFGDLLTNDMLVGEITCHYGGTARRSIDVPTHQSFKRSRTRQGRDRQGGGAELNCSYHIRVKGSRYEDAVRTFRQRLSREEMAKVLL